MVRQAHHERRSVDFEKALAYPHRSLRGAQRRGNLVDVEHTSANHHHCYGDEIANPRIEYGVAMTSLATF